jgi:hypothetical protein
MIFTFIITLLLGLLTAVFSLIPEFDPLTPGSIGTGNVGQFFDSIAGMLLTMDLFVPIGTMFLCWGIILGTKAFVGVVQLVVFVWDKLPFKSS